MAATSADIVIVGGGQAGISLSYRLTELGLSHVVLEQGRLAESWRTRRWDSLRLIAPNWTLQLSGFAYSGPDPDGFMGKDEVVERIVGHARTFGAPVREGVRVASVERHPSGTRFVVTCADGDALVADSVVLATGALQRPDVPPAAAEIPASVTQILAQDYRNPASVPSGPVLVVGSGQTGAQIAEELTRAGRTVSLSVGRSWWAPRRYRGQDMARWMRVVGWFDRAVADLPPGVHVGQADPQLTGADGGHDISSRGLARAGVTLLGRLEGIRDGSASFADDLATNLAWADDEARRFLRDIDAAIERDGIDAPIEEWPAALRSEPAPPLPGPRSLDLRGVGTLIWATGYRPDFDWVRLPFTDDAGYPIQRRGVTGIPGLYVLGLHWLYKAKSGIFAGIDEDATYLASVIAARGAPGDR